MTRRIAFFAHYDPDGIIDDYVVHYLNELSNAGITEIWFSTDCNLVTGEINKLPSGVKCVCSVKHGEYDFGSWKRCLEACGDERLKLFDELILCNDSCYGPLQPFSTMLDEMDKRDCDFWGVTQVEYFGRYFPSFFLGLKRSVFLDPDVLSFLQGVGPFEDKIEYCKRYEVGLFNLLLAKGYKDSCYLDQYSHLCHSSALGVAPEVFKAGMPFIRGVTVKTNPGGVPELGRRLQAICSQYDYPITLIQHHVNRVFPAYRKYWAYLDSDAERTLFGVLKIRTKPKPETDQVRIKAKLFGLPVFYATRPMRYAADANSEGTI